MDNREARLNSGFNSPVAKPQRKQLFAPVQPVATDGEIADLLDEAIRRFQDDIARMTADQSKSKAEAVPATDHDAPLAKLQAAGGETSTRPDSMNETQATDTGRLASNPPARGADRMRTGEPLSLEDHRKSRTAASCEPRREESGSPTRAGSQHSTADRIVKLFGEPEKSTPNAPERTSREPDGNDGNGAASAQQKQASTKAEAGAVPQQPAAPRPTGRIVSPGHEPTEKEPPVGENPKAGQESATGRAEETLKEDPGKDGPKAPTTERPGMKRTVVIEGDRGPIKVDNNRKPDQKRPGTGGGTGGGDKRGGGGGGGGHFHQRMGPIDFAESLKAGRKAVIHNMAIVMFFTIACNVLVLAIPIYLFQISDRVLTSQSTDTLTMLTVIIVAAVVLQTIFDAIRRFILMRTGVEVAAQLGAPILSAAARASLHSNGREYQVLGDLQQLRSFLVSGTLLSILDAPIAPLFVFAVFLVHPDLGWIVVVCAAVLLVIALINQRATTRPFHEATNHLSKANLHLDSMARNSQIINALAMIPEAVKIWGQDTANSLKSQVVAQDRNIISAGFSKGARLLTQVAMLGWGANLAIHGELTGGMAIAASIIAGRALAPIEGAIEGWHQFVLSRAAYGRIANLLQTSPLNFERLRLPRPEGRLDVERLLFVPPGTKQVILNGINFSLAPGDSLAIIGNSGAGKTTLGKMIVGSILPTSGSVRLDLMDLRNWDQRQFGESIGYLPQDVQLFPGTIKANIARMRDEASDQAIFEAASLADVHELIASFPLGYETPVAADGSPLSGGQKQRVALARAFFGNPRLVVLDEPNSNLDAVGDSALARALAHAKRNKITMITITQRAALLQCVDKIMLLNNGTVTM